MDFHIDLGRHLFSIAAIATSLLVLTVFGIILFGAWMHFAARTKR